MKISVVSLLVGSCIFCYYILACHLAFRYPTALLTPQGPSVEIDSGESRNMWRDVAGIVIIMSMVLTLMVLAFKFIPNAIAGFFYFITVLILTHLLLYLRRIGVGKNPSIPTLRATGFYVLLATVITFVWATKRNWLIQDLVNLSAGLWILVTWKNISLRWCLTISVAIVIYDVTAVFFSGQMIELATAVTEDYPFMMVVIPESLSLSAAPMITIGVGDLVLPGAVILLAHRLYGKRGSWMSIAGYLLGVLVAVLALTIYQFPQPATLYLIPMTLLGLWIAGRLSRKRLA